MHFDRIFIRGRFLSYRLTADHYAFLDVFQNHLWHRSLVLESVNSVDERLRPVFFLPRFSQPSMHASIKQ